MTSSGAHGCQIEKLGRICVDPVVEELIHVDHIPSSASIVQGRQTETLQSVYVGKITKLWYQAGRSTLYPLDELLVRSVERPQARLPNSRWGRTRDLYRSEESTRRSERTSGE